MRVISIDENDSLLFGEELSPDYYLFYLQHKDAFRCMWKDQPPGFWVRCVISFRNFMWQKGLIDDARWDNPQTKLLALKQFEDAFCNLVTFLTNNKISALSAFIEETYVVASNRHQLIHILDSSHTFDPFYNKTTRSAFRSLFGDPTFKENLVSMAGVIDIYLHFTMFLIKILKKWLTSEEMSSTLDTAWKPPRLFLESDAPHIFEGFLKERFGEKLFEFIGVQQDNVSWWDKIDLEQSQNLRRCPTPQSDIVEGKLPWQMGADDPEMGTGPHLGIKVAHLLWMYFSQSPFLVSSTPEPQEEFLSVTLHELPAFQSCYYIYYSIFGPRFHSSICKIVDSLRSKSKKKMVEEINKNQRPSGKKAFLRNNRKQIIDDFIAVNKKKSIYENRTYSIDKFIRKWEGIYNFSYSFRRETEKNLLYICMDMPYLNTYLEKSMNKLLDLEYNFIPFKIFPILKELHQPLERILVLFKETKLLLHASIALMEEIQRLEGCDSSWLSRLQYHKELHNIIPKFDRSINKLGQLVLKLLDTLLQQAWSKQERKTGRCNPGRTRINPRFHNLATVPDLERLFVDNHRHLVFWLNMDEVPDVNKRHTHFKEVYKILKDYLAKMSDKEQCKKWDLQVELIDNARELTEVEEMIFAKLKLTSDIKDFKFQQAEFYKIVKSLTEDSYLDEETAKQINNWLKKLNLPAHSDNWSDKTDNRLKDVIYLQRVGSLYILAKSIINIYPFPRNKRNSFNQIFQDECNHLLLASACKFVRSVQEILNTDRSHFVPCPPPKCFKAIQDLMYKFSWEPVTLCSKDIVSGLDEFRSNLWADTLETLDKDNDNDNDKDAAKEDNDSKASGSIDVMPYLAKLKISSIDFWTKQNFNYWINVFEGKLFVLTKKVADKYFQLGESYSECAKKTSNYQFPHWHTLYVHLREELAHIRQQIADDKPYAYQNKDDLIRIARLSQLTYHRLRWIESEVDKWCADPASPRYRPQVQPSIDSGSLVQRYATARIRFMWADSLLCGNLPIFSHQIGIFSLRNDLMKLFDNWEQFIESILFHDLTFWSDLGDTMLDFTQLTEHMTDYLETFKQHCIFVWNEPLTLCDPDAGDFAHHDIRHARLVTLALLRFHIVSYYIYLTVPSDEYLKTFQHSHRLVLEDIIYTLQQVQDNLNPQDEKLNKLWNTIDRIWTAVQSCVPSSRKAPGLVNFLPTYIVGETDSWKKVVDDYIYGRHDRIAAKLDLNTRKAYSVPPSEPIDKTHKKKSKNKQQPPIPQDEDTRLVLNCVHINFLNSDGTSYDMCIDTKDILEENQPSEDKQPVVEKGSSAQSEGGTNPPLDTCTLFTKETETNHPKKGRNQVEKGKAKANSQVAVEHLLSLKSNNTREMVSGPVTNPESKPRRNTNLDAVGRTDETSNKFMVGSSDKRCGPVPEKNCDKKEISTTSSVCVTKTKLRGLRSCANCLLKEPSPLFYQKCRLCKTQKMKLVRFYCSRECQVAHWKTVHQAEHAEHTAQTSAH